LASYNEHFDAELVKRLIETEKFEQSCLDKSDENRRLSKIVDNLEKYFSVKEIETLKKYTFKIEDDQEVRPIEVEGTAVSHSNVLRITVKSPLKHKNFKIDHYFLDSLEYSNLVNIWEGIGKYFSKKFFVEKEKKEDSMVYESLGAFSEMVLGEAKKGSYIQRYKGLGEMNPEQLWETTMNPAHRTLLQVRIEDARSADDLFSLLMGDQVLPRREFVENNALNVRNLDI
ncbi:MAG: DNA gyrase subunit B, partial [Oligoflexia bacterium]|nr:DNA gyrase subunit B [Oligoflexia bacterium]